MKRVSKTKKNDVMVIDVSREEYDRKLAAGADPENTLRPGRHKFVRGGFLKRHPELTREQVREAIAEAQGKTLVSIRLDSDILTFFKKRAADPLAAGYQTQINAVLRQYMAEHTEKLALPETSATRKRTKKTA